ncbi:GntR family transcriptional regulator [Streptomyces sp. RB6PN25]|uniref:GntR family transcriptional regulator n=1 Tax=Streptomyces humicola TaxID=2953240 RepID=A0ABT1PZN3_9ACTN|nr:GntR family transcriptional regulator [Streptomyces humicola]MCQ4083119.1 GntR family transcriptional regulator [Streptomyces humicola]
MPGQAAASPFETVPSARGEHVHPDPAQAVGARRLPERYSLRDQVLRELRSALVTGDLRPGAVYSAPALAERFGVSATPVREAMHQLVREGSVEVVHNRGFRVTERTARDLAELAEVRALVELPVLQRLAHTVPAEQWEELRPLAAATVDAAAEGDRAAYAEADRAFHGALLALSGNAQLVVVAEELHRRAQCPVAQGTGPGAEAGMLGDATEHVALLDALAAGDVEEAEGLLREHFGGSSWA